MQYLSRMLRLLRAVVKTLQLALPKIGIGWMFALLTIDFNRIAIVELGVAAILITAMLGLHYFLSPFQVVAGRLADRHPLFGLRRTPYLLLSSMVAGLLFMALPPLAHAMGAGSTAAVGGGFLLFILFGIAIAFHGDSHHALIAEVTEPRARGAVISVVQIVLILSTIVAAVVMNIVRPEYSPEAMQRLYNLTPFIVILSALIGVLGMEKRLTGDALRVAQAQARAAAPEGNPLRVAAQTLRANPQARGFFVFLFVAMLAIFLQDNILEVFGAEVFGMSVEETTRFQPTWGGGVLIGMLVMGALSVALPIRKKTIALIGCGGTVLGMLALASAALLQQRGLVFPTLFCMGIFTGFFNVGALAMMMDMTIEGATGLYMGLWGMGQSFGTGLASFGSGALHTGLIESGLLSPSAAYFGIFAFEGLVMAVAGLILYRISVAHFHDLHETTLTRRDLAQALEAGAVA